MRISNNKRRALLTETLPYEVPISFSAENLFLWAKKMGVTLSREKKKNRYEITISNKSNPALVKDALKIIFGTTNIQEKTDGQGNAITDDRGNTIWQTNLSYTDPYTYSLQKNTGGVRNLSIMHPLNMIEVADFVAEYAPSILYFTNRSPYSLRHPSAVRMKTVPSTESWIPDRNKSNYYSFPGAADLYGHYFVYEKYELLGKYFSSSEFSACERKYQWFTHTDIANCFGSIYTHTISWVTNGYVNSKRIKNTGETFGGQFDKLMQRMNSNETHGILIGPEISRIFAEIILQEIDLEIHEELTSTYKLKYRADFDIRRYVDDYFIFCNDENTISIILNVIDEALKQYKMVSNPAKLETLRTPIIHNLSSSKKELKKAVRDNFKTQYIAVNENPEIKYPSFYFNYRQFVTDYKRILNIFGIDSPSAVTTTLTELEAQVEAQIKDAVDFINEKTDEESTDFNESLVKVQEQFQISLTQVLTAALFLYSSAPSFNHALKISKMAIFGVQCINQFDMDFVKLSDFRDSIGQKFREAIEVALARGQGSVSLISFINCLTYLEEPLTMSLIDRLKEKICKDKDAISILTFLEYLFMLRDKGLFDEQLEPSIKELLKVARDIIESSLDYAVPSADATILLSNLVFSSKRLNKQKEETKFMSEQKEEVLALVDISQDNLRQFDSSFDTSMYQWNISYDIYVERLHEKRLPSLY